MNEELNQEELTSEEAKASLGISTRLLNLMLGISDEQQMKMAEQDDRQMQQNEMDMQNQEQPEESDEESTGEEGMKEKGEEEKEEEEEDEEDEMEKEGMDMEKLKPEIEKIIKSTLSQEIGKLRSDLQSLLTEESNEKNNGEQKQD